MLLAVSTFIKTGKKISSKLILETFLLWNRMCIIVRIQHEFLKLPVYFLSNIFVKFVAQQTSNKFNQQ